MPMAMFCWLRVLYLRRGAKYCIVLLLFEFELWALCKFVDRVTEHTAGVGCLR